jgi:hypothetical protein
MIPLPYLTTVSIIVMVDMTERADIVPCSINLAYQELYLVLAAIFRKYDLYDNIAGGKQGPTLALYDTLRERDVDMMADMAVPMPALGSKGVRIQVM